MNKFKALLVIGLIMITFITCKNPDDCKKIQHSSIVK